jgi:putative DNA primase/helicase
MIGHLPETLADRCLIIRMQRKSALEKCERLRELAEAPVARLRRQCVRFVLDRVEEIARARPALPPSLNDRATDICEPLLVLADLAGGRWPEMAREAVAGLSGRAQRDNPIGSLLLDIFVAFTLHQADRIFSRTLVANLQRNEARPWMQLRNGKQITDTWLADQLRPYEIRPRNMRIGKEVAKGYYQEDFLEIFRRYISAAEVQALREQLADVKEEKACVGETDSEERT